VMGKARCHLPSAEASVGIVAPVGRHSVNQLLRVVTDPSDERLPEVARACVAALGIQLRVLKGQILQLDRRIMAWHECLILIS
jgi:transposase